MSTGTSRKVGLLVAATCAVEGVLGSLVGRAYQTDAVCAQEFSWMENEAQFTPCVVAANLIGPCRGPDFTVRRMTSNSQYDVPMPLARDGANTVDECYCSLAVYNLLNACAACQNVQAVISSWASWNRNCGNLSPTNRSYPERQQPPPRMTLPFWASTDPTEWPDARFQVARARQIANEGQPDITLGPAGSATTSNTSTSSGSKSNIGAIVGGVVGGIVALAIGVGISLYMFCRSKRNSQHAKDLTKSELDPTHMRSASDMSGKTFFSAYQPLHHVSSPSNGSIQGTSVFSPNTIHTHNQSITSVGFHSSNALSYASNTPPPVQGMQHPGLPINSPDIITPFIANNNTPSHSPQSSRDRKAGDNLGETFTTAVAALSSEQRRLNPPAYSESPRDHGDFSSQAPDALSTIGGSASIITTPPSASDSRHPHEKNRSLDSQITSGSGFSGTSGYQWNQQQQHRRNESSFSAAGGDLLSQVGGTSTIPGNSVDGDLGDREEVPSYPGPANGQGQGTSRVYRDEKRPGPVVMNVTPARRDDDL